MEIIVKQWALVAGRNIYRDWAEQLYRLDIVIHPIHNGILEQMFFSCSYIYWSDRHIDSGARDEPL